MLITPIGSMPHSVAPAVAVTTPIAPVAPAPRSEGGSRDGRREEGGRGQPLYDRRGIAMKATKGRFVDGNA